MKPYIICSIIILQSLCYLGCRKDDSYSKGESTQEKLLVTTNLAKKEVAGSPLNAYYGSLFLHGKYYYYSNLEWTSLWGNILDIQDFYNVRTMRKPMKVFIKRDTSNLWIEVPPVSSTWEGGPYAYYVVKTPNPVYNYRSLIIYYNGDDVDDTPDVKVVFK